MTQLISPPALSEPHALHAVLQAQGYAVLNASGVHALSGCAPDALAALPPLWADLPADAYLKDGGRYRRRRHSCFVVEGDQVRLEPHRAHWQPVEYNALHGGMQRLFEPLQADLISPPVWRQLLIWLGKVCSARKGAQAWFVEAHQFRIDTTDGIGRPTPEGAHRDGVDMVAVFLVDRSGVKGGESRVFDADGPNGQRFTLTEPWSLVLLDDERVVHETTPIQPVTQGGHRDTLVLTLRAHGFQGDRVPVDAGQNPT